MLRSELQQRLYHPNADPRQHAHRAPRAMGVGDRVDGDPRAFYFQQATNGLYVRMALLTMVLES